MTLLIKRCKLAYFPVPKIACTSIKHMLHEMKTGEPFKRRVRKNGKTVFIHALYPALPFADHPHDALADWHRVAVVRDPVKRLLSAYGNRVLHHRELSVESAGDQLKEADLAPDPDLATFINKLEAYFAAVPKVGHHAAPLVTFLGHDPGYFTRLYAFSELPQMQVDMRALTGKNIAMPHLQIGGPKLSPDDLTSAQIDRIRQYYAEDYQAFAGSLDQPVHA